MFKPQNVNTMQMWKLCCKLEHVIDVRSTLFPINHATKNEKKLYTVDFSLYFGDIVQLLYILKSIPCKENIFLRSVLKPKYYEIIAERSIINIWPPDGSKAALETKQTPKSPSFSLCLLFSNSTFLPKMQIRCVVKRLESLQSLSWQYRFTEARWCPKVDTIILYREILVFA